MRSAVVGTVFGICLSSAGCGESTTSNQVSPSSGGSGMDGGAATGGGGAVGASGASGASGTSAGGASTAQPIPIGDLCPLFIKDLCIYLMQCSGARYRDAEHCQSELDCFGLPQLLAAEASGAVVYDPSKVGECHERFIASPCNFGFFLFTPDIYEVLAYCPGTVTPKLPAGGTCASNGECGEGLYCYKGLNYQCPGVCQPFAKQGESCAGSGTCSRELNCQNDVCEPDAKVGSPCTFSCDYSLTCPIDQVCATNLWCDRQGGQCESGRLEGEVCGTLGSGVGASSADCAVHLWCDALGAGTGLCRKRSALGGPCNDDRYACAEGLHCEGYVAGGTTSRLGQCVEPAAAAGECARDEDCQEGLVCIVSSCGPPATEGQPCGNDGDCAPGLVCPARVCVRARYPGDACNDTDQSCTFSRCVQGTCQAHAKVGDACALAPDCATGECVQGRCYDPTVCATPR